VVVPPRPAAALSAEHHKYVFYDAMNRLTSKAFSDTTPTQTFFFDEASVTVAGTVYTLTNTKGRVSHTTVGSGTAMTVHSYDKMDGLRIYGSARLTIVQAQPSGRCITVTIWRGCDELAASCRRNDYTDHLKCQRVTLITSSLSDATHPGTLAQNISYAPHGPWRNCRTAAWERGARRSRKPTITITACRLLASSSGLPAFQMQILAWYTTIIRSGKSDELHDSLTVIIRQ